MYTNYKCFMGLSNNFMVCEDKIKIIGRYIILTKYSKILILVKMWVLHYVG